MNTIPTEQETRLWVAINIGQRRLHRVMEQALREAGLPSLKWYDVLWGIERAGENGVQARHLMQRMLFEQSNLSRIISKMVNEGLVVETVNRADRRGKVLHLTSEGKTLRAKMWAIYGPLLKAHMEPLGAADDIDDLMQRLIGDSDFEK